MYNSTYQTRPFRNKNHISETKIDHSLSSYDSELLGGNLTFEECTNMKLNISFGLDALSVKFYVLFGQS